MNSPRKYHAIKSFCLLVYIENELKKQEQKTELLDQNFIEFNSQKKTLDVMALEFETKFSRVELEKKKLSSELQRNESLIELEEKRVDQKGCDLEARMAKFAFEQNTATIELEKKKINVEVEKKAFLLDLEKEHLTQRKTELEKSIAALDIEKEFLSNAPELQNDSESDESTQNFDDAFVEIELARKISLTELERKESVIKLEQENLSKQTELLEKKTMQLDDERKISSNQIQKIESNQLVY